MDITQLMQAKGFSPFRDLVGVTYSEVRDGYSRGTLEVSGDVLNAAGSVHGGAIYTLADSGMGVALMSCLNEGEICATIENKIIYFKPVRSGTLVCDSRVISRSKRIAAMESEVHNDGQLVAKAIGTFSISRHRGGSAPAAADG
jgi:acyl-CoA thioesterase